MIKPPTATCPDCDGEGIGGEYVPELCGEGEDRPCETCGGSGTIKLPFVYEVCGTCRGHGMSSAYLGAFTPAQLREDPEWAEEYMRGDHDRTCEECNGKRVVPVVDETACKPELLQIYFEQQRELADMRRCERMERMMEGGWREEGWYES